MDKDMTSMESALAHQIRVQIADQGTDQTTLAEAVGMSRGALNRYLMGHVSMTSRTFYRIAEALDVAPSTLLARAEERLAAEDKPDGSPS